MQAQQRLDEARAAAVVDVIGIGAGAQRGEELQVIGRRRQQQQLRPHRQAAELVGDTHRMGVRQAQVAGDDVGRERRDFIECIRQVAAAAGQLHARRLQQLGARALQHRLAEAEQIDGGHVRGM
jgi:hypothetical protein